MFLVQCCPFKGQSSDAAGVPTGRSLWAGLCLEAATLNSMLTRQLSTEVPLLSYEDATHFIGFVGRIPCAPGFESQPHLALFTQRPLLKCPYPLLNLSSSNVKYTPFFFFSLGTSLPIQQQPLFLAQYFLFWRSIIQSFITPSSIGMMGDSSTMLEGTKAAVKQWLCTDNWQRHSFKYLCKCLGSHMAFIFPHPAYFILPQTIKILPTEAHSIPSFSVMH